MTSRKRRFWPAAIGSVVLSLAAGPALTDGLLSINGTELFVKRIGAGEPVVVLHGGPLLDHGYLLPHLEPLGEGYELILFDQRLCGRSAATVEEGSVTLANFVADVEALRAELGLERIHLLAHSFGGLIAMRYALAHPDRVRSLVLLDSISASSAEWQREQQAGAAMTTAEDQDERQALLASEGFERREPEAIEELLRIGFRSQFSNRSLIEGLRLFVPDTYMDRSAQYAALGPDLADFDLHRALSELDLPALVLYGADEPGATIGGPTLRDSLQAEWVLIEKTGHFPFIEQRDEFLVALRGFLSSVP